MDADTKQKITEELTAFLKRPPSEDEIMNAQADFNIMGKVRQKQNDERHAETMQKLDSLQATVDVNILKADPMLK